MREAWPKRDSRNGFDDDEDDDDVFESVFVFVFVCVFVSALELELELSLACVPLRKLRDEALSWSRDCVRVWARKA